MPDTYRSIQGELRLLEQENDFLFPIEIWAYNDKLTLNGWRFENLEAHREKWAGIPVLCAYVNGGRTIGSGHNQETRRDKSGEEYQSFVAADAERIVGATSEDSADMRVEEDGEHKWLVAKATLYRWYARELTDLIISKAVQGGSMEVSIEALVTESHMDGDVEVETSYIPLGITILGEGVDPAVPGAHVAMLSEMESEFKELKLRAASYQSQPSAEKPQHDTNNKGVKHRMNKTLEKELALKFPDYRVIGASEDGLNVALMSKDSAETFSYSFAPEDKGAVLAERMQAVSLDAAMSVGENTIDVDFAQMMERVCAEVAKLTQEKEALEEKCQAMEKEAEAAKTRETARRIKASAAAAVAQLAEINANRAESDRFDDAIIDGIKKCAENGGYADCENSDGEWCGEEEARKAVRDVCMMKQMEQDKAKAAEKRTASVKAYPWEAGFMGSDTPNGNSIDDIYASM